MAFRPDMAVMTSQSLHIRKGLSALPIVSIEQAPLPRLGHPQRTMLDPCGHQVGSILAAHAEQIRSLPLSPDQIAQASRLLRGLRSYASHAHPNAQAAQAALRQIGDGKKIALLATQPVDWVTYEGAYQQIEMENLVYCWADQLPEGWIGVPTYHVGQRLNPGVERELAQSHPKLRILPPDYSSGITEALLAAADGLITISSTSAMTAILFGKKTVVMGQSPFNAWCTPYPELIGTTPCLPEDQAARLLAFLTNRVVECDSHLNTDARRLSVFAEHVLMRSSTDWLFDMTGWSEEHALRLFAPQVAEDVEATP
jgi:hypothetical protein